jgi:hypothetical protein
LFVPVQPNARADDVVRVMLGAGLSNVPPLGLAIGTYPWAVVTPVPFWPAIGVNIPELSVPATGAENTVCGIELLKPLVSRTAGREVSGISEKLIWLPVPPPAATMLIRALPSTAASAGPVLVVAL